MIIPSVIRQTSHGERSSDIFSRLLEDRIVFLGDEVNDDSARLIVSQLLYLEGQDSKKDISLYINSPGGAVTAGFAIYDTMQFISCDVSTICVGLAASFAAVLLSGGAPGKRYALPHSEIMIHQPHGGTKGSASDIRIMAEYIERNKGRLNQILSKNTGRALEQIEKDTDRDTFMTAKEAKEYGMIDQIFYKKNEAI